MTMAYNIILTGFLRAIQQGIEFAQSCDRVIDDYILDNDQAISRSRNETRRQNAKGPRVYSLTVGNRPQYSAKSMLISVSSLPCSDEFEILSH